MPMQEQVKTMIPLRPRWSISLLDLIRGRFAFSIRRLSTWPGAQSRHWLLGGMVLLSGCDLFWLDTAWHSDPYRLIEIDTHAQMSLSIDLENGTGVSIVDRTVFSIGSDEKYIVVKQHPKVGEDGFDRAITNYFVVTRVGEIESSVTGEEYMARAAAAAAQVRGPLKREQYERLAAELHLPKFTKTFHDLE